jgi:hypothetical protein
MSNTTQTVRLKVSPDVAKIVTPGAPRSLQLMAARGALPLSGRDLVTALFFLCHRGDGEIRTQALKTIRELPAPVLTPTLHDAGTHPQLLDFVARNRLAEPAVMEPLLTNPAVGTATLVHVAGLATGPVLSLVAHNDRRLGEAPEIIAAILANPRADRALKFRLGWQDPAPVGRPALAPLEQGPAEAGASEAAATPDVAKTPETREAPDAPEAPDELEPEPKEEVNLSKYQLALEMGVADKIKIALTGDKEWRTIFLKDANKLVSSAALKNPRITEGEVLTVAKSKNASDELIRLITIDKEWTKSYEIRKALVLHPRTPLPKALRYLNVMNEKDLKGLAKSRDVSQALVNNARRMLLAKEKKGR